MCPRSVPERARGAKHGAWTPLAAPAMLAPSRPGAGPSSGSSTRKERVVGLFKKLKGLAGGVPSELANSPLVGRGQIVGVEQTNVSTGGDTNPSPVCVFTVEVALDGTPPYQATCR